MSTPESVRARLKPDPDEAARRKGVGDDVERLVAALAASGISITPDDAYAAWRRHSGRVRQRGVISGVPPGRIVQAALGVICSGVTSSICGVARAVIPSICM